MEIALKLFSLGFNPMQLNFIRFSLGALLLLPISWRRLRKAGFALGDLGFFALSGFICVVLSMTLYQLAILRTPASIVAVLFSCNPVFVVPLAVLVLGERIRARTVVALVSSLVGIAFILNPFRMGADSPGIALTLLSALSFALYGVLGSTRSPRFGSAGVTCLSFAAGSIELLALMFLSHLGPIPGLARSAGLGLFADIPILSGIGPASLPGLLYVGICVTGLGYTAYFMAIEASSASTASLVFFIKPALAPILALIILGESLTLAMAAGIAFIVAGSAIALLPGRRGADT